MRRRIAARLGRVSPLAIATAVAVVMMLAVGALIAALIAVTTSTAAAGKAHGVAACLNTDLGDRNGVQTRDNDAIRELGSALVSLGTTDKQFAAALNAVLAAPKPRQAAEYSAFLRELRSHLSELTAAQSAAAEALDTLVADQRFRDAHPLGTC